MANGEKYLITKHHLYNYDDGIRVKNNTKESHVIKMHDSYHEAVQSLIKVLKHEPDFNIMYNEQEVLDELEESGAEKILNDGGRFFYTFELMHDYENFYLGPGAYSLGKTVLS